MIITIELVPANEGTTMMWRGCLHKGEYTNYASGHNANDVLNSLLSGYIMKKVND